MFERYQHVRLKNGFEGVLIEVLDDGEAYLFERDDAPYLDDDVDSQMFVVADDIVATREGCGDWNQGTLVNAISNAHVVAREGCGD